MSNELVKVEPNALKTTVDSLDEKMRGFLEQHGLPWDAILVPIPERQKVFVNLESVTESIPANIKSQSMYISKFMTACAAGMFDAALNYLWDETVLSLRRKIVRFDLNYFLDSVITDSNRRAKLKNEDDLKKVEDWELVKGCHQTGIITEQGYRHLDYIRDMRNHASAAHPNQNDITGLQMISWLETCIKEVITKEPQGLVLEVKRLITNIRNLTFAATDVPEIVNSLHGIAEDLAVSLTRTIFGMFADLGVAGNTRNNILLVVPSLWPILPEQAKHSAGMYYATLAANGEVDRKKLVHQLLEQAGGLPYLTEDSRALALQQSLQDLEIAHKGFNNFYSEGGPARTISSYIGADGRVPAAVVNAYVKTLVSCRMGNGYGVSWAAESYYSTLVGRFDSDYIAKTLWYLVHDNDFSVKLGSSSCASIFHGIISGFKSQTGDANINACLDYILNVSPSGYGTIGRDTRLKALVDRLFQ